MCSCQDLLARLGEVLDDQVTADFRRDLQEHLSHCRRCVVLVNSTRETVRIVTEHRTFVLPPGISSKIMKRICGAKEDP